MFRKLNGPINFEGKGLHTGKKSKVIVEPHDKGYIFVKEGIEIPAKYEYVCDTLKSTSVEKEGKRISTVEHILSALYGNMVVGARILVEGDEIPVMDGSSKVFSEEILKNSAETSGNIYTLKYPLIYEKDNVKIMALPSEEFKISYVVDFEDRGFSQFAECSLEEYSEEISPARTFVFKEDVESILSMGLGKGGDINNVVVIGEEQGWRFYNEPARHKILDFLGDLALCGVFIKAHYIIFRGSHKHHVEFARLLYERGIWGEEIDTNEIFVLLPHRYPFLLVDKIYIDESKAVGIKNITVNEEFFKGHFPENPIMPGVLQIESMAQVAGAALMKRMEKEDLIPLFVGIDRVKFRRIVKPGDTLFIYVNLLRFGGRFAKAKGEIFVGDDLVAEAVMSATFSKKN